MSSFLATLPAIAAPLPAGSSRVEISDGTPGIAQTIAMMQKLVGTSKRNIRVREIIRPIIDSCNDKDYYCYAKKMYEWVRNNIKYVYDPHQVEYLEAPEVLLRTGIGDCDSMVILLASFWEQAGLKSQYVTVAADPNRPGEYTHVYCRVYIPKYGWISADPIMKNKYFGWEAEDDKISARRYWPGSTDDINEPLDTRPSIQVANDGSSSPLESGMFGLTGYVGRKQRIKPGSRPYGGPHGMLPNGSMVGFGALAHGGGGGHGGHGGRGGFGPGWGYGGWGPDGGDTYIVQQPFLVPVAAQSTIPYTMIPTSYPIAVNTNSISFIPVAKTNTEMNSPAFNQSETLTGFGCEGQRDDATVSKVRDFITGSTLQTIRQMGEEYEKNLDAWQTCEDPEVKIRVLLILRGQHDDYTAASSGYDQILSSLRDETTNPIVGGTIKQVLDRLDNSTGMGDAALVSAIGIGVLALLNIRTIGALIESIEQSTKSFFQKDVDVKNTLTAPPAKKAAVSGLGEMSFGSPWLGLAVVAGAVYLSSQLLSRK